MGCCISTNPSVSSQQTYAAKQRLLGNIDAHVNNEQSVTQVSAYQPIDIFYVIMANFPTFVDLTPPLRDCHWNFVTSVESKNWNDAPIRMSKSVRICSFYVNLFTRRTGIGQTDRQTDGQIELVIKNNIALCMHDAR